MLLGEHTEGKIPVIGIAAGIGLMHAEGGSFTSCVQIVPCHTPHRIEKGILEFKKALALLGQERGQLEVLIDGGFANELLCQNSIGRGCRKLPLDFLELLGGKLLEGSLDLRWLGWLFDRGFYSRSFSRLHFGCSLGRYWLGGALLCRFLGGGFFNLNLGGWPRGLLQRLRGRGFPHGGRCFSCGLFGRLGGRLFSWDFLGHVRM